jgi:hypothetical protein
MMYLQIITNAVYDISKLLCTNDANQLCGHAPFVAPGNHETQNRQQSNEHHNLQWIAPRPL